MLSLLAEYSTTLVVCLKWVVIMLEMVDNVHALGREVERVVNQDGM